MKINLAFEGGGAKGLVHVGILKRLEEEFNVRNNLNAVAGTSAGAIVAALVAAGIPANEIIDDDCNVPLLQGTNINHPAGLIKPNGVREALIFRCFKGEWLRLLSLILLALGLFFVNYFIVVLYGNIGSEWFSLCLIFYLFLLAIIEKGKFQFVLLTVSIVSLWMFYEKNGNALTIIGQITASTSLLWFLIFKPLFSGLMDPDFFSKKFNEILSVALFPEDDEKSGVSIDKPRIVRFSDLKHDLFIVATDISEKKMKVFSKYSDNIAVADAVAASIAIPLIFKPKKISHSEYCDGGLVSNLPAWTLDEHHVIDPDLKTIAVSIDDDALDKTNMAKSVFTNSRLFDKLISVIKSAVFGASDLSLRVSGDIYKFSIPISNKAIGLLEFDMDANKATNAIKLGYASGSQLKLRLKSIPELYTEALMEVHDDFLKLVEGDLNYDKDFVRVNISAPDFDAYQTLRIRYKYWRNGTFFDDKLVLPIEGSIMGEAYKTGDIVFDKRDENGDFSLEYNLFCHTNRYRNQLLCQDLEWFISLPICAIDDKLPQDNKKNSVTKMYLTIDSNITIDRFMLSNDLEDFQYQLILIKERIQSKFQNLVDSALLGAENAENQE